MFWNTASAVPAYHWSGDTRWLAGRMSKLSLRMAAESSSRDADAGSGCALCCVATDAPNAGERVRQREIDDAGLAAERHNRLGAMLSQFHEPGPAPPASTYAIAERRRRRIARLACRPMTTTSSRAAVATSLRRTADRASEWPRRRRGRSCRARSAVVRGVGVQGSRARCRAAEADAIVVARNGVMFDTTATGAAPSPRCAATRTHSSPAAPASVRREPPRRARAARERCDRRDCSRGPARTPRCRSMSSAAQSRLPSAFHSGPCANSGP